MEFDDNGFGEGFISGDRDSDSEEPAADSGEDSDSDGENTAETENKDDDSVVIEEDPKSPDAEPEKPVVSLAVGYECFCLP